jgi:ATP phosphoribosyltransferase
LYEEYSQSFQRQRDEMNDAWCVKLGNFTDPRAKRKPTKIVLFGHNDDPARDSWDVRSRFGLISKYPNLTRHWFKNLRRQDNRCMRHSGISVIRESQGTTEAHVPRDYRYGVCLTESGATLKANNLRVLDVILETYPVLLAPSREKRNMPEWKCRAVDDMVKCLVDTELLIEDNE